MLGWAAWTKVNLQEPGWASAKERVKACCRVFMSLLTEGRTPKDAEGTAAGIVKGSSGTSPGHYHFSAAGEPQPPRVPRVYARPR